MPVMNAISICDMETLECLKTTFIQKYSPILPTNLGHRNRLILKLLDGSETERRSKLQAP